MYSHEHKYWYIVHGLIVDKNVAVKFSTKSIDPSMFFVFFFSTMFEGDILETGKVIYSTWPKLSFCVVTTTSLGFH